MIVIYGRPGCGACENVKRLMDNKNISFTYIDISQMDERGRDKLMADADAANMRSLPLIIKNGKLTTVAQAMEALN